MKLTRFNWLAMPLLLAALSIAQDAPKPAAEPKPDSRPEMTEAEKKDLTIANQALKLMEQEAQLIQRRLEDLREAYQAQRVARAEMLTRIEKSKGQDVSCDAEKLVCARLPDGGQAKKPAKPEKP